jgi:hypothetical protein
MGLIGGILLAPIAPVRGVVWVAERIAEEVERQELSEAAGVRQLEEIDQQRQRGEIDEDEARAREAEIIKRQRSRANDVTDQGA